MLTPRDALIIADTQPTVIADALERELDQHLRHAARTGRWPARYTCRTVQVVDEESMLTGAPITTRWVACDPGIPLLKERCIQAGWLYDYSIEPYEDDGEPIHVFTFHRPQGMP